MISWSSLKLGHLRSKTVIRSDPRKTLCTLIFFSTLLKFAKNVCSDDFLYEFVNVSY